MTLLDDERSFGDRPLSGPRIEIASRADAAALADALAAAFDDDPVFRWFSPDDRRRHAMLPGFFAVFVDAFMTHGETYTGARLAGARLAGAALWSAPGTDPLNTDPAYAERLAEVAGADAPRLFEIVEILEAHAPQEPYYHLQFLGVRPERQGAGLGGRLMAPGLARCDGEGAPVYLEATSDRNRALYERHGFRAHGQIRLPGGPALWRMWREPVA
jgi:GNAT superfamily N-acetyltransferase